MADVYSITNTINGKIYIGWTSKTAEWRFSVHMRDACQRKCWNKILYKSIRKYGKENFRLEKILVDVDNDTAKELEEFIISECSLNCCIHKNNPRGMNMTDGGEGVNGYVFDEMTRKKMSESAKNRFVTKGHPKTGKHLTDAMKKVLSKALSGENNPRFGKEGYWKGKTRCENTIHKTMRVFAVLWTDGRRELYIGLRTLRESLGVSKNVVANWTTNRTKTPDTFKIVEMCG